MLILFERLIGIYEYVFFTILYLHIDFDVKPEKVHPSFYPNP